MRQSGPKPARTRISPAGLVFLAITSVGWGFNWPATKYLVSELPPLTLRGSTGVIGACLLALLAVVARQRLRVPPEVWPRLVLAGVLIWLPASETALIAYTMPVWATGLAWPVLGERLTLLRTFALLLGFLGLAAIMGGNGLSASMAKLPGIIMALCGSMGFAVGTVLAKRWPIKMAPIPAAAWQIAIGCLPVALAGFAIETVHAEAITPLGWWLLLYSTVAQFCVAYVCWFAALSRLPASVAAIGTMAVPLIGVVASALALHEPLGRGQVAALILTIAAVALATGRDG